MCHALFTDFFALYNMQAASHSYLASEQVSGEAGSILRGRQFAGPCGCTDLC